MRNAESLFYIFLAAWQFLKYHVWKPNADKQEVEEKEPPLRVHPSFNNYDVLLQTHNPHYAGLSRNGRIRFVERLRTIRDEIEIQGRDGFIVTEDVKVLICACITQLTYGFNEPHMPFLKGVVVFPSVFYSRLVENWVKGLAMGNGVVFISWEDFVEGYKFSTSTYNLGLHEFAHMLRFQALQGEGFDVRLATYFDDWEANGHQVFDNIRVGGEDFFREYAGQNKAEFFSVCIENFFEVPENFSKELPDLYWHLCHLLKQNPLNKSNDYLFDEREAKKVNVYLEDKIPLAEPFHLPFERNGLVVFQFLGLAIGFFIIMHIFNKGESILPYYYPEIRMVSIGALLVLLFRYSYHKSLDAIFATYNLQYFFRQLLPALLFLALIFEFIFNIILEI